MRHYQICRQLNTRGFTLLEVLVAVLVLSVGLLGLASLQANGLKMNYSAYQRTMAILLANDMADRMRANPTEVVAGTFNAVSSAPGDPGCMASACTTQQLADHDLANWYLGLQELPNGTGTIVGDGTLFTITVMWDDERDGATGTGCNPNNSNDMLCFTTVFIP